MTFICDNHDDVHISSNPIFHERTKPIKIEYHFIQMKTRDVKVEFVNSND